MNHSQSRQVHQPKSGSKILFWILGGVGALTFLCCGGGFIGLAYIGTVAPDTSVYVGNQLPNKFVVIAEEMGAVEPGEKIQYFYSAAFMDVKEEFVLVTKDRVVICINDGRSEPLEIVKFSEIKDAELTRNESFLEDSEISLELKNGGYVWFEVSSEYDRDQDFFNEIDRNISRN